MRTVYMTHSVVKCEHCEMPASKVQSTDDFKHRATTIECGYCGFGVIELEKFHYSHEHQLQIIAFASKVTVNSNEEIVDIDWGRWDK